MTNTTTTTSDEAQQAAAQLASIVQMVAALDVDYIRLQQLRDEYEAMSEDEIRAWTDLGELRDLEEAAGGETVSTEEDAREAINQHPLSVQVRSDWVSMNQLSDPLQPTEFCILLCTGGPAVRIMGDLNQYREPCNPRIEYQGWGTPWTELTGTTAEQREALEMYCTQFYFGE